jgi:hypothetical protein
MALTRRHKARPLDPDKIPDSGVFALTGGARGARDDKGCEEGVHNGPGAGLASTA